MTAYQFSWHEKSRDDIWQWLIVNVMSQKGKEDNDKLWKTLLDKTDGGKNCVVTMQVNGVEVDTQKVFERLVENMEWIATNEAKAIVANIPGFGEISDLVSYVQHNLKFHLRDKLKEMGLDISEMEY